jgi:hypothetical protein
MLASFYCKRRDPEWILQKVAKNITAQTQKQDAATKEVTNEINDVLRTVKFNNCKIDKLDKYL